MSIQEIDRSTLGNPSCHNCGAIMVVSAYYGAMWRIWECKSCGSTTDVFPLCPEPRVRRDESELHESFTAAVNACGRALTAVICFWLTLLIALLEGICTLLRLFRAWFVAGAKLPRWILPFPLTPQPGDSHAQK
jgi:hypothetical protein